jgi:acyl phosphate:glycerol-3-phosphate acyltransferase
MPTYIEIIFLILAYLLGSIPTSVWIGKIFFGIDIREYGSGNAGATNTFRILGVKAGIPVLIFDIFKGWAPVRFLYLTNFYFPDTSDFVNFQLMLGIAAVLGHIFPIYEGFKGGKGVATLMGVILAIHPESALICAGVFIISLLITHYVSLSSMITGMVYPILIIIVFNNTIISLSIFSLVIAILLLFTHQKNIERLLKKEEAKAKIFKRKSRNIKD